MNLQKLLIELYTNSGDLLTVPPPSTFQYLLNNIRHIIIQELHDSYGTDFLKDNVEEYLKDYGAKVEMTALDYMTDNESEINTRNYELFEKHYSSNLIANLDVLMPSITHVLTFNLINNEHELHFTSIKNSKLKDLKINLKKSIVDVYESQGIKRTFIFPLEYLQYSLSEKFEKIRLTSAAALHEKINKIAAKLPSLYNKINSFNPQTIDLLQHCNVVSNKPIELYDLLERLRKACKAGGTKSTGLEYASEQASHLITYFTHFYDIYLKQDQSYNFLNKVVNDFNQGKCIEEASSQIDSILANELHQQFLRKNFGRTDQEVEESTDFLTKFISKNLDIGSDKKFNFPDKYLLESLEKINEIFKKSNQRETVWADFFSQLDTSHYPLIINFIPEDFHRNIEKNFRAFWVHLNLEQKNCFVQAIGKEQLYSYLSREDFNYLGEVFDELKFTADERKNMLSSEAYFNKFKLLDFSVDFSIKINKFIEVFNLNENDVLIFFNKRFSKIWYKNTINNVAILKLFFESIKLKDRYEFYQVNLTKDWVVHNVKHMIELESFIAELKVDGEKKLIDNVLYEALGLVWLKDKIKSAHDFCILARLANETKENILKLFYDCNGMKLLSNTIEINSFCSLLGALQLTAHDEICDFMVKNLSREFINKNCSNLGDFYFLLNKAAYTLERKREFLRNLLDVSWLNEKLNLIVNKMYLKGNKIDNYLIMLKDFFDNCKINFYDPLFKEYSSELFFGDRRFFSASKSTEILKSIQRIFSVSRLDMINFSKGLPPEMLENIDLSMIFNDTAETIPTPLITQGVSHALGKNKNLKKINLQSIKRGASFLLYKDVLQLSDEVGREGELNDEDIAEGIKVGIEEENPVSNSSVLN
ncbi:MAG: hypothetical protein H2069_07780 [Legionella sp.]|nr:hypothetical protein [Legionella sp.]